jgi:hypothetical protein
VSVESWSAYDEGYLRAYQWAGALAQGSPLPQEATSTQLGPGEVAHAHFAPVGIAGFFGEDTQYRRSFFLFGGPVGLALTGAASLAHNASKKAEAEQAAIPRWHQLGTADILVTNQRMVVTGNGQTGSFWYAEKPERDEGDQRLRAHQRLGCAGDRHRVRGGGGGQPDQQRSLERGQQPSRTDGELVGQPDLEQDRRQHAQGSGPVRDLLNQRYTLPRGRGRPTCDGGGGVADDVGGVAKQAGGGVAAGAGGPGPSPLGRVPSSDDRLLLAGSLRHSEEDRYGRLLIRDFVERLPAGVADPHDVRVD